VVIVKFKLIYGCVSDVDIISQIMPYKKIK